MGTFGRLAPRAIVLAAALAAAGAARAEEKEFGDWVVGCDNVRTCIAIGLSADGADVPAYIKVTRSGEADAPVSIKFVLGAGDVTADAMPLRLAFDDPAIPGLPAAPLAGKSDGDSFRATLGGAPAAGIVAGFRKARSLTITPLAGQAASGVVSLSGAVAALLYIDDRQKRVGTLTALLAKGEKPASSVPPPPILPVVAARPIERLDPVPAVPKGLPKPADDAEACHNTDGNGDKGPVAPPRIAARLSSSLTLWGVCREEGGYGQVTYDFYLVGDGKVAKAGFEPAPGDKVDGLVAPYFLAADAIGSFFRARAIGDCGDSETWAWDGTRFRLLIASFMSQCRGVASEDWPVSYRAEKR